jgi:phenylacetate-CoA ligase
MTISPFLRKNIFEPLQGIRSGSPRLGYWRRLENTQYLSEEELLLLQNKRLAGLLNFVYENNYFYRERFDRFNVNPEDVSKPSDLAQLPVLTKDEIRRMMPQMISKGYHRENLLQFKTGGSTGKSLAILLTEECSEMRNACLRRHDRWTGWEVGEPIGAVWGNPKLPNSLKAKARNWLLCPFIYLDTMAVNDESVKRFAREWRKVKPSLLFGHAHSLFIMSEYIEKIGIEEITPRAILSTSMMLLPHERRKIEEIFKMKVFDRYGSEEVSLIASECDRHQGMHLNIEHLVIEFLDDDNKPVSPGCPGRIVVTDLMNYAMPFIRYEVGDAGVPIERKCNCGRGLPLMDGISGRLADFLIKKDGTKVAGVSLIENTLTKIGGIEQMQIVQDTADHINIKIVAPPEVFPRAADELSMYFKEIFGNGIGIEVEMVSAIQAEASGKYRFSICKIQAT